MHKSFGLIFFIILVPLLARSQEPLQVNASYVSFEINRTPIISGGFFLQDLLAIEGGFGFAANGDIKSDGLGIRVGLDKYLTNERLAPFIGGFTQFIINPNALHQSDWKGSQLSVGGHFGLNFFVLKNLSVAGTLGGELQFNSPKDVDSSVNFTTFTSGIKVRLFF